MQSTLEKRSDRKRRQIMQAATKAFVAEGYDGTSMDEYRGQSIRIETNDLQALLG